MNDQYIFRNKETLSGGPIRFKFPYSDIPRVPNMSIKLIQGTVGLQNPYLLDDLICCMRHPASNYTSDDNTGTTLGLFSYKGAVSSDRACGYEPVESQSPFTIS